jgi:hypothetical protein
MDVRIMGVLGDLVDSVNVEVQVEPFSAAASQINIDHVIY